MSGTDANAEFDGPMFTVAIPVYNREDLVERTLESVYAQSFTDYEIVCVNDGSKDGSLEVLRRHEPRVRVVDQENTGLAGARNTGAREARGRYVIFLDSDDLFLPWSLEVLAEAAKGWAERNDGRLPAMVSGQFSPFDEESEVDGWSSAGKGESRVRYFDDYLTTRASATGVAPSGTAVLRDVYEATGASDVVRVMFEDVDIWFKVGAEAGYAHVDEPVVAAYRVGHASMMGNMKKQLDGFDWIAGKVRGGEYPSGSARRGEMEEALALHAKGCAFRCLHMKDRSSGMAFYTRTLGWQAKRGDWKFIASYPVLWLLGKAPASKSMRSKKKQVVSDE